MEHKFYENKPIPKGKIKPQYIENKISVRKTLTNALFVITVQTDEFSSKRRS